MVYGVLMRPAATEMAQEEDDHVARGLAARCRGVTKEFGRGESKMLALRGVDLEVRFGEMTLLVGPSGCGKTTLISVIAGLLAPTDGDVEVLGEDLRKLTGGRLVDFRGANLGFVFQQYNLLPALTAAENAAVPLMALGRPRREAVQRASELLEAVGLGNRLHSRPSQLSGGQQQRVAVHPGRAVIVVTHDSRVLDFGERIVHMGDGRVERVEDGAAERLFLDHGFRPRTVVGGGSCSSCLAT